jgi:hypothetical protein
MDVCVCVTTVLHATLARPRRASPQTNMYCTIRSVPNLDQFQVLVPFLQVLVPSSPPCVEAAVLRSSRAMVIDHHSPMTWSLTMNVASGFERVLQCGKDCPRPRRRSTAAMSCATRPRSNRVLSQCLAIPVRRDSRLPTPLRCLPGKS